MKLMAKNAEDRYQICLWSQGRLEGMSTAVADFRAD